MDLVAKRFADTVVLFPVGRIDHATAEPLRDAIAPHVGPSASGRDRVVIDLSGVEYISSVGLRVLMVASKEAKAHGRTLAVCGLQPVVREIFEISKFTLVFPIHSTVRDALADVSPRALAAFEAV